MMAVAGPFHVPNDGAAGKRGLESRGEARRNQPIPLAMDEAEPLGAAVALWVAGFDLFYSLFDRDFDLQQGLHSVAVRFGAEGAFWGARSLHVATVLLLAAVGLGLHLGWLYWLGVIAVALLLVYEHSLVRPGDLRRLDAAFFTVNGVISVVFFAFVLAEAAS